MGTWPSKDPNEVLDYLVQWSNADPELSRLDQGETLTASTFSVVEGDVVIDDDYFDAAGDATVWLSGGTAGLRCKVLNRVTTSANRIYDQTMIIRIKEH